MRLSEQDIEASFLPHQHVFLSSMRLHRIRKPEGDPVGYPISNMPTSPSDLNILYVRKPVEPGALELIPSSTLKISTPFMVWAGKC